jgi:hypothetical protein
MCAVVRVTSGPETRQQGFAAALGELQAALEGVFNAVTQGDIEVTNQRGTWAIRRLAAASQEFADAVISALRDEGATHG